jgi:hypothetical protein
MLVSTAGFSEKDVARIDEIAREMQFELVLSPRHSIDANFAELASAKDLDRVIPRFPIKVSPPTDDSPFFFQMLHFHDIFNSKLWNQGVTSFNMKAVFVLGALLLIVFCLTVVCIIFPLALAASRGTLRGSFSLLIFFGSIGLGFMLVEISQMQRLTVFLGHPTYGLSVLLFAILLSSGIGSYLTQRIGNPSLLNAAILLCLLQCALVMFGLVTPLAIECYSASTTSLRIFIAVGMLFPLGLFMGMPFPLGMKIASAKTSSLTPWFWGINGATSVCGSVLAVAISLHSSITTSFWVGVFLYGIAFLAIVLATLKRAR